MTTKEILAAYKSLSKKDRDAFLVEIVGNSVLRRDLLDLVTLATRQREPSRPFREYLAERKRK
jgi:hypothetical protein